MSETGKLRLELEQVQALAATRKKLVNAMAAKWEASCKRANKAEAEINRLRQLEAALEDDSLVTFAADPIGAFTVNAAGLREAGIALYRDELRNARAGVALSRDELRKALSAQAAEEKTDG